jgi:hypothetical protein
MSQRKLGACNLLTQAGFHTRGFDKANLNDERVVDRRREIPGALGLFFSGKLVV